MKKVLLLVAVVAFATSFTSCNKCVECKSGSFEEEFCSSKKALRDSYKSSMESLGYNCN